MSKYSVILLILLLAKSIATAQGFDWQHSARLPSESPKLFFGLDLSSSLSSDNGKIGYFESFPCIEFDGGSGSGYSLGVCSEYWTTGSVALFAKLNYKHQSAKFTKEEILPMIDGQLVTQYSFSSDLSIINLQFGAKKRLFESYFSAGAALGLSVLMSNSNDIQGKVISPPEWHGQEPTPFNGSISDYSRFNVTPSLFVMYDLNLGLDTYATVRLGVDLNAVSMLKSDSWSRFDFILGISIFRGFIF